jgi:hypothetical protein
MKTTFSLLEYILKLPDDSLITLVKTDWGGLEMICGFLSIELNIEENSENLN